MKLALAALGALVRFVYVVFSPLLGCGRDDVILRDPQITVDGSREGKMHKLNYICVYYFRIDVSTNVFMMYLIFKA